MLTPRLVVWIFPVALMVLGAGAVSSQSYPNKPIRIVTTAAGGGADLVSRLIAQEISGPLGQPVIVDNRGGGGSISGEIVARAAPDGYTLLLPGSTLWLAPLLRDNVPYDPVRDFAPITLVATQPSVIVVHPSVPVTSIKELIALAKAKAGQLNYASAAIGSAPHIAAELFKAMAGVNIVRIPYQGGGAAVNALIGGEVQLSFATAGAVTPHVKSGRLRALGVTSAKPSALTPDLPTVAASGLLGYESMQMNAMFAPAKTPAALISRLNREIMRVINRADVKEKFLNSGVEPVGSSPEQLAAAIKSDTTRAGKVIRDAGIREQ